MGGASLGMLHGQRLRVPAQGILAEPLRSRLPARSRHVDGEVDRGHQRIRMVRAQRAAAAGQGVLADPDGLGQVAARGQVGGVIDASR